MKLFKSKFFSPLFITFILFIIPFFWLKPNEMDLGGDGNRLFFYDPWHSVLNDGFFLYQNVIEVIRTIEPHFSNIPFDLLLLAIKTFINSPYFLISLLNGIKVSVAFLSIYLIICTILKNSFKEKNEHGINMAGI